MILVDPSAPLHLPKNDPAMGALDNKDDDAMPVYRSAKLPLFSGESVRQLEARIRQTHELLSHYHERNQVSTSTTKDNDKQMLFYTVVTPSQPGSFRDWTSSSFRKSNNGWNCKMMSDETARTVSTTGSYDDSSNSISTTTTEMGDEHCSIRRQSTVKVQYYDDSLDDEEALDDTTTSCSTSSTDASAAAKTPVTRNHKLANITVCSSSSSSSRGKLAAVDDGCDWGYFVDTPDAPPRRPPPPKPERYRHFLTKEIHQFHRIHRSQRMNFLLRA